MNILLIRAATNRLDVSLCVAGSEVQSVLDGQVGGGSPTQVELHDPQGNTLYRHDFSGTLTDGLLGVLAWLASRHIRVDLAMHHISRQGEQGNLMRMTPLTMGLMADFPYCAETLACIKAVAAAYPDYPQFTHFAAQPKSLASLPQTLRAAGVQPPTGCPQKKPIRCETCCAA